jgi:hypothetical protein
MELRWFEPSDARVLIDQAVNLGLLEETTDGLKTTFDHRSVEIPLGFKPPKDLLSHIENEKMSLLIQIVDHICLSTNQDEKSVIAALNEEQKKTAEYLTLEVLAILYGESHNVDMSKFISMVKSELLLSNGE